MADEKRTLTLRDYAVPEIGDLQSSIVFPPIQANNFDIVPAVIQMMSQLVQFGGLQTENPTDHIRDFLEICDTFKQNGVSTDAIRLRLFPFSLQDRAREWLISLPSASITTWDDLAQKFMTKFFPPRRTAQLTKEILTFTQHDSESLYEAWDRYKGLLRKCPHHGLPKWLEVQTFYDGLSKQTKTLIDVAAGGALMSKSVDEGYELIEEMATNSYQWPNPRAMPKKVAGVLEVDELTSLKAQVAALTKKLELITKPSTETPFITCEICGNGHHTDQCPEVMESVQYVNNHSQNDPYANTYDPGFRKHPNFSWGGNQGQSSTQGQPLPMHNGNNMSLAETLHKFMETSQAQMRALEAQLGHISTTLHRRPQGVFPSDTEPNPQRERKKSCQAATLRNGRELEEVEKAARVPMEKTAKEPIKKGNKEQNASNANEETKADKEDLQSENMEAHKLERLSIGEGKYDSDSDSEGLVEDSVDDELCYASSDIPKLQFRKEASKAKWIEELGMAEVLEKKGKMWNTTGIVRDGKTYFSIEETLYLAEIGALHILNEDDVPLTLTDMYAKLAEDKSRHGCSWESFEVYRHLKFLGYIVRRHNIPWSIKNIKISVNNEEDNAKSDSITDNGSVDSSSLITEMFGNMHFGETRPIFDVYPPNSKFKKSSPGNPSFVLCLTGGNPPSKQEIEQLEMHCSGNPLKFCVVEHGRVTFLSFTKVELPVLP